MLFSRHKLVARLDFIVGGAQKAGTTALHEYLKQHPNITMPYGPKELHFFDNDEAFRGGTVDYAPLHAAFRPKRDSLVAGECTPIYLFWKPAVPRIREYNPQIKLIFILRDPVTRAFSQWNMQRVRGTAPGNFLEALEAAEAHTAAVAPQQSRKLSYIERSRYAGQIEHVRSHFPDEQLLFLKYENFRDDQQGIVDLVYRFLKVPAFQIRRTVQPHRLPYTTVLQPEERGQAQEYFRADIAKVEQLLGWDCSDWGR